MHDYPSPPPSPPSQKSGEHNDTRYEDISINVFHKRNKMLSSYSALPEQWMFEVFANIYDVLCKYLWSYCSGDIQEIEGRDEEGNNFEI